MMKFLLLLVIALSNPMRLSALPAEKPAPSLFPSLQTLVARNIASAIIESAKNLNLTQPLDPKILAFYQPVTVLACASIGQEVLVKLTTECNCRVNSSLHKVLLEGLSPEQLLLLCAINLMPQNQAIIPLHNSYRNDLHAIGPLLSDSLRKKCYLLKTVTPVQPDVVLRDELSTQAMDIDTVDPEPLPIDDIIKELTSIDLADGNIIQRRLELLKNIPPSIIEQLEDALKSQLGLPDRIIQTQHYNDCIPGTAAHACGGSMFVSHGNTIRVWRPLGNFLQDDTSAIIYQTQNLTDILQIKMFNQKKGFLVVMRTSSDFKTQSLILLKTDHESVVWNVLQVIDYEGAARHIYFDDELDFLLINVLSVLNEEIIVVFRYDDQQKKYLFSHQIVHDQKSVISTAYSQKNHYLFFVSSCGEIYFYTFSRENKFFQESILEPGVPVIKGCVYNDHSDALMLDCGTYFYALYKNQNCYQAAPVQFNRVLFGVEHNRCSLMLVNREGSALFVRPPERCTHAFTPLRERVCLRGYVTQDEKNLYYTSNETNGLWVISQYGDNIQLPLGNQLALDSLTLPQLVLLTAILKAQDSVLSKGDNQPVLIHHSYRHDYAMIDGHPFLQPAYCTVNLVDDTGTKVNF